MQYLLLIYEAEEIWENKTEAEKRTTIGGYLALNDRLRSDGQEWTGKPLLPTSTATSIRVRAGERQITDGPFAETKEQLAGFYLLETDTLQAAIEYAALIPAAREGTIEIRPVADHSGYA